MSLDWKDTISEINKKKKEKRRIVILVSRLKEITCFFPTDEAPEPGHR